MANLKGVFLSKSDEWSTPWSFFDEINKEFNFNLDPCATDENHKCDKYYTVKDDGLTQNWGGVEYFVIHHIVKLISGLKKHLGKQEKIIL